MILTHKEKWVADRLKKEGWKIWRDDLPEEYYLYRGIEKSYSSEIHFVISRKSGSCRMEFRPMSNKALHLNYYFYWPSKKNWHKINEVINYFWVVDNNVGPLLPQEYR